MTIKDARRSRRRSHFEITPGTAPDFKRDSGFFIPSGTDASPLFMALAGSDHANELVAAMPKNLASRGRCDRLMTDLARALS